jgi:hypothetical protein
MTASRAQRLPISRLRSCRRQTCRTVCLSLGSESHIPRWSIRLCAAGNMILTDQEIVLIEEVEKLYKKTKA